MDTTIIAVSNHKGGVGKTTSVVNIGAGLALIGYKEIAFCAGDSERSAAAADVKTFPAVRQFYVFRNAFDDLTRHFAFAVIIKRAVHHDHPYRNAKADDRENEKNDEQNGFQRAGNDPRQAENDEQQKKYRRRDHSGQHHAFRHPVFIIGFHSFILSLYAPCGACRLEIRHAAEDTVFIVVKLLRSALFGNFAFL